MDVKLSQLAEGVESGTVVSILVAEGQEVKKDQAIMELETQKAVGSIPAPSSGIVTKIYVKQGMDVAVGHGAVLFIAVGTPPDEDGSADMQYVLGAAREIGRRITGWALPLKRGTRSEPFGHYTSAKPGRNSFPIRLNVVQIDDWLEGAAN